MLTGTADRPPELASIGFQFVLLACYGILWLLISDWLEAKRAAPAQAFWHVLVAGAVAAVLCLGVLLIPGAFTEPGQPATVTVYIKSALLAVVVIGFCFILVLRFRDLVRFRRTKKGERNWKLLLVFMLLSTSVGFAAEGALPVLIQSIFTVSTILPALALITINVFRISWIVHMPARQKAFVVLLGLLVLGGLTGVWGLPADAPISLHPDVLAPYLIYYSIPLFIFVLLSLVFGLLYTLSSVLSLIFHLPTSEDFRRSVDEIAAMQSLTALVREAVDFDKLAARIVATPVEAGRANAAWLAILEYESGSLDPKIVATHKISAEKAGTFFNTSALYNEVAGSREPVVLQHVAADHRVAKAVGKETQSLVVAPLSAHTEVLGALFVTREVAHGFQQDDLEAIRMFAAQATLAIENARLFESKIERERLARELGIAREVQQRLLPQSLPQLDYMSLAASSESAYEVGGDYYDILQLESGKFAFIVADVSGKGTSAAFYMAEMQGIFQSVANITPDPCQFLHHANQALGNSLEKNVFVSAIYGLVDYTREELVLARAGHCPAAIVNTGGQARLLRSRGIGMGLDRHELFGNTLEVEHHEFQPGDVVVLYTDGVVESRNAVGEEFGYERLIAAIQRHRHESAQALHDLLLLELNEFRGEQDTYEDDRTLLIMKWHGASPRPKTKQRPSNTASP